MVVNGVDLGTDQVKSYCKRWKIGQMSVFGSILRSDFGPKSDVDILIRHEPDADWDCFDHLRMQDELSDLLTRRVDLLDYDGVDASPNRLLRKEILSTARPVYGS